MRSIPATVLGPVLSPPCSRQRPFFMAGHWQGVPFRVLAPHRWALLKSPTALLLFSHPCRRRWDVPRIFWLLIFRQSLDTRIHAPRHHRLTTTRDVHMLHYDNLLATGTDLV